MRIFETENVLWGKYEISDRVTERLAEHDIVDVICVDKDEERWGGTGFQLLQEKGDYFLWTNTIHWQKVCDEIEHKRCIITSNIHENLRDT